MDKEKLIQESCEIISKNLGPVTADYYKEFYQNKDLPEIQSSILELLNEIVGPKNAKKQLQILNKI